MSHLTLKVISLAAPWEAHLLSVSGFPAPESELSPAQLFLQNLSGILAGQGGLASEVFVQFNQLHRRDGPARFGAYVRAWMPRVGLGAFPDEPPPAGYTKEDFEGLAPGEKPRPLMHQLFRITTSQQARDQARDVMLGLGTVVQVWISGKTEVFLDRGRQLLLPPIKDPMLTAFTFYVPLFRVKTLAGASTAQLEDWFCGASVYIRESAEDNAILIASREPLESIFKQLGGKFDDREKPVWQFDY